MRLATAQSGLDICDGWNSQFRLLDIRSQFHRSLLASDYALRSLTERLYIFQDW